MFKGHMTPEQLIPDPIYIRDNTARPQWKTIHISQDQEQGIDTVTLPIAIRSIKFYVNNNQ